MTPSDVPASAVPVGRDSLRLPRPWWWLTTGTALLAALASLTGLLAADRIYGEETVALSDAATAQDLVTLVAAAPLVALLALRARQGSVRALLCLPGCLAFLAYNGAIYALSVHFGPLFLAWVAGLGLSIFALLGALTAVDGPVVKAGFAGRAVSGPAWFLVAVGTLFVLLWLGEIVPDLLAGGASRSASDWDIPTNPVHVLDLAFFLPAVIASGVLLLRGHPLGYATAAAQLVWLALTCLPILVTPLVAEVRGHPPGWTVAAPVGALFVATLAVLWRLLKRSATAGRPAGPPGSVDRWASDGTTR